MRSTSTLLCPLLLCLLALSCAAQDKQAGDAPAPIEARAPIKNFILPKFTAGGVRTMLLHGEEARLVSSEEIAIKGMNLNLFNEKNPKLVETLLTATSASFFTRKELASGDNGVLVRHDDAEMSGTRWNYDHKAKKVVIEGKVRVIFQSQIGDILK